MVVGQLDTTIHDAFAAGLQHAFTLAGATGLIGAVLSFLLLRNATRPTTQAGPTAPTGPSAPVGVQSGQHPLERDLPI
jgi:hypothetical protein